MNRFAWPLAIALLLAGCAVLARNVSDPYWLHTTDFGLYLHAAKQVAAGGDPYAPIAARDGLFFGQPNGDGYIYPPVLAWALAALLWMGDTPLRLLWIGGMFASLVAATAILLRGFGSRTPWPWIVGAIGVALLTRFFRTDLYHGQANPVLLLALVFGTRSLHRGDSVRAAAWWSVMIMVKPFCAVLVAYLLWRRQWTAAVLCLSVAASAILASFLVVLLRAPESAASFEAMAHYYSAAELAGGRPDNISIHGLAIRLFEANRYTIPFADSHQITVTIEALTIAVLAAPFLMRWNDGERKPSGAELLVQVTLAMAIPLVWGPMTNGSHLMLLLPGVAGALMLATSDRRWRLVAAVWSALFLLRMTPVRLESRWFGNLFGGPPEATWETASGFWTLWTAQATVMLVAAALLMGWASVVRVRDLTGEPLTASEPEAGTL
jgi:hypothetical protein